MGHFLWDGPYLIEADAGGRLMQFVDDVEVGAARSGESFGRWPDGEGELYPMRRCTLASENSGPRIGPVIISEVMYHAPELDNEELENLEFIEIYNPTGQAVDLAGWRIADGIDFEFAEVTTLAARSTLVVAPFDPADTGKLNYFCTYWEIADPGVVVGGYSNRLSNAGERVQLQRPNPPPPEEPSHVPYVLEDEITYDDEVPWPDAPDGGGQSLHRATIVAWGNDPASWLPADPTPGTADLYVHPGDANLDDVTDVRDFNIWNAHKFTAGTDWTTGDFNFDGRTDVRDFNIWNAHKFTSATAPPPADAVLAEEWDGPDTATDFLAGLLAIGQPDQREQSSGGENRAKAAVDKLLAVCLMYPDLFP